MNIIQIQPEYVYSDTSLPFGMTSTQVVTAVNDFYSMYFDLNGYTVQRGYGRLETLMREATFSDFVGESLNRALAKSCPTLKRNLWNNGFPDLLSRADNLEDAKPRGIGIEIKASRSRGQWQAHNREAGWFLVFRFVVDTRTEDPLLANPFEIVEILAAELTLQDWSVSRGAEGDILTETPEENSEIKQVLQEAGTEVLGEGLDLEVTNVENTKRRTRTTSTNALGTRKLRSNPIYAHPDYVVKHKNNPLWTRLPNQSP